MELSYPESASTRSRPIRVALLRAAVAPSWTFSAAEFTPLAFCLTTPF
jgi:hypothetical protein